MSVNTLAHPKPGPKRRGRAVKRDPEVVRAARRRDGRVCLYGLVFRDGCLGGVDVAHIKGWGATGIDTLENVISLCRKHHRMHEEARIPDIVLQGILYRFYGYGPEPNVVELLDYLRGLASERGLAAYVDLEPDRAIVTLAGTFTHTVFEFSTSVFDLPNARDILRDMLEKHVWLSGHEPAD